jgi:Right handed beta helix region
MNTRYLLTIAAGVLSAGLTGLTAAEFHVAPAGSDAAPGTDKQPFATLTRARDAVRALKQQSGLPVDGVDILIHAGRYSLSQTLELTPADSGAKGRTIRYRAANGETPVLTSAREITGWKRLVEGNGVLPEAARGQVWFAEVARGWRFHALYVNGVAQQVARFPNLSFKDWRSWPHKDGPAQMTSAGLRVTIPTVPLQNLPTNGDVEVCYLPVEYWNILAVLKGVEGNTDLLASRNPNTWYFGGNYADPIAGGAMQFRNALALLNQPGEWCVDSAAGRVYFWPPDGTMEGKVVTAPTLDELIRLQGDDLSARSNRWRVKYDALGQRVETMTPPLTAAAPAAFDQLVHHVEFRGLAFECTDRLPEDEWPADWLKRNCENPDGALFLQGVEEVVINNCACRDCGAYAIVLDHYAQRVSVLGNEITRCGSGGVQATGYGPGQLDVNHHHVIRRNHITSVGREYMHAAAVTIFGSGENDISLNWISDCPYVAVQICGADQTVLNNPDDPEHGPSMDFYGDRTAQFQMRSHELPPPNERKEEVKHRPNSGGTPAGFEEVKPYLHSGGNWVARNVVDEYMTTLGDGGALYNWSVDHNTVWMENLLKRIHHRTQAWVLYADDWAGRQVYEANLAWASAHGDEGAYLDNSHTPPPAGRPSESRSVNTTPEVFASGNTLVWFRDNITSFPGKPGGFDARFKAIQADAELEGGWPKSVTPELIHKFLNEKPKFEQPK